MSPTAKSFLLAIVAAVIVVAVVSRFPKVGGIVTGKAAA